MEHTQIQSSDGSQVMTINGQQLHVVQMNTSPHVVQGPNGQQIMVHAIATPTQTIQIGTPQIQVATPNGQQIQQLQVLPISNLPGANNNLQSQLVQTPDGQMFLYQPTAQAQPTIDQHQIIHQPTVINLNGNLVQIAGVSNAVQQQPIVNQPNIVMMVNGTNNTATPTATVTTTEGAGSSNAGSDEEPLLYVNARQYKQILKRRAARARLHELGKIPKERPKYLHESRHRHAMNRIRGEGGRFHSGSRKNMENSDQHLSEDQKEDIKPDTVSITIIQDEQPQEPPQTQWRRLAPHQPLQST